MDIRNKHVRRKNIFLPVLPIGHSEQIGSGLLPRRMQGPLSGHGHGLQSLEVPFKGYP